MATAIVSATTKASPEARQATTPMAFSPMFLPTNRLSSIPSSGIKTTSGTSAAKFDISLFPLAFHRIQFVDVDGFLCSEDRHDQRQPDGDLGGGYRDHEEDDQLPACVAPLAREGDQGQIRRVEHQFNRHKDHDRVAPDQHTEYAHDK